MTKIQIEHAMERVAQISRKKLGMSPDRPSKKTFSDLLKDVADNKITVTKRIIDAAFERYHTVNTNRSSYHTIDFDQVLVDVVYEKQQAAGKAAWEKEQAKYDTRNKKLSRKVREVEDNIMLGDSQEALALLESLANFNV
jgi:hypothetical protein